MVNYMNVDNNKTNNPRTYELTAKWISEYELTSIVEYENVFLYLYVCDQHLR
jgi:hypothetical protein